jgi:hypothetical protein
MHSGTLGSKKDNGSVEGLGLHVLRQGEEGRTAAYSRIQHGRQRLRQRADDLLRARVCDPQ